MRCLRTQGFTVFLTSSETVPSCFLVRWRSHACAVAPLAGSKRAINFSLSWSNILQILRKKKKKKRELVNRQENDGTRACTCPAHFSLWLVDIPCSWQRVPLHWLSVPGGRVRDAGAAPSYPFPSCRRGTGSCWCLGPEVWVPSGRWGWGGCGCWRWPSPAAGGRRAARVRRCAAASAVSRPETLRAKASATSSSTVGAGAGRGNGGAGTHPVGRTS